ncbi:MAG: ABC-2 family transporter protein [Thermomicrobiales bacterium]
MRYLRLYGWIVSLSIRRTLAFRANFVAETLVSVINVVASLIVIRTVFQVSESLQGWTQGEATVLLGLYLMGSGLLGACVEPNLRWFRDQIQDGQLDEVLLRPASSAFLASLGTCAPLVLSQSLAGVAVFAAGLTMLDRPPTLPSSVLATVLFAAGCLSIWAVRLIMASLAFWAPAAQPDVGFRALWEFGRYPSTMYATPIRIALTWVIPVALVATLPAQVLAGNARGEATAAGVITCTMMVVGARLVWLSGLRRYASATS